MRDEFDKILGDALRETEVQAPDLFDAIAARRTPAHLLRNKLWLNRYRLMGAAVILAGALTWFLISDRGVEPNGATDESARSGQLQGIAAEQTPAGQIETTAEQYASVDEAETGSTEFENAGETATAADQTSNSENEFVRDQADASTETQDPAITSSEPVVSDETPAVTENENEDIENDEHNVAENDGTDRAGGSIDEQPEIRNGNSEIAEENGDGAQFESWTFKKDEQADVPSVDGASEAEETEDAIAEVIPEVDQPIEDVVAQNPDEEQIEEEKQSENAIDLPTPPIKPFSIQIEAGPSYAYRTLNGERSLVDMRNAAEAVKASSVFGVKFNYELGTNWETFAGLTYTSRSEAMNHTDVNTVTEEVVKTVDVVVIDPVEGARTEQVQIRTTENREVSTKTNSTNTYQRLLVPVGLRYNFFLGERWNLSPSLEGAVQVWNRNSGLVLGADGEMVDLASSQFNSMSVQARLGGAVGVRINARNSLIIEPGISTFVNPVNTTEYPLRQRDFAIDFRFGWKVNF